MRTVGMGANPEIDKTAELEALKTAYEGLRVELAEAQDGRSDSAVKKENTALKKEVAALSAANLELAEKLEAIESSDTEEE